MRKLLRSLTISMALAAFSGLVVPAHATTIISGDLFFTTFQNQSGTNLPLTTDVWKVSFIYDSVAGLCLGTKVLPCGALTTTPIKTLTGADGIEFDPNDATNSTLLIGEQNTNRVARLSTDGTTLTEMKADGANAFG